MSDGGTSLFDHTQLPGTEVLAKAQRKRSCTTRIILAHVGQQRYLVLTPAGEILDEDFGAMAGCLFAIRDFQSRAVPLSFGKLLSDFEPVPDLSEFEDLVERADSMLPGLQLSGGHQGTCTCASRPPRALHIRTMTVR